MAINRGVSSASVYLLPGMSIRIEALDHFIRTGEVQHTHLDGKTSTRSLVRGFLVDNQEVGDVDPTNEEEPAVLYRHKKFAENLITFYALTGERGQVFVISVPIHDHSSIITGGPAYGTYFTDDELHEKKNEEGTT
jgi:hypothetical protein